MIHVTPPAAAKLQALLLEHPDDAVVLITLKDLDDQRLVFSITLEAEPLPDDHVYEADGVTIAIEAAAVPRVDGARCRGRPACRNCDRAALGGSRRTVVGGRSPARDPRAQPGSVPGAEQGGAGDAG
jgi:hypothetical protein